MIKHQIEALADAGVTDIVLAVNYRPEIMEAHLKEVSTMPPIQLPRSYSANHTPSPSPSPAVREKRTLCNLLPLFRLGCWLTCGLVMWI